MTGIRIGYNRILSVNIQTFDFSFNRSREHFCCMQSVVWIQLHAPCLLKFLQNLWILHFLISREVFWLSAHIAGTLYVILTTQWIDTASRFSKFSYHQCHIGHGHNALCSCGMLRNTKTVDDWSLVSFCIHSCSCSEVVGINVADFSNLLRCVIFDDLF